MDEKTRFIIQVDETFYVTTGPLMVFDPSKLTTDEHRAAYVDVAARFKMAREECDQVYRAVKVIDDGFSVVMMAEEK